MNNTLRSLFRIIAKHPGMVVASCLAGILTVTFSSALFGLSAWLILFTALKPGFELIAVPVVGVRLFGISRALFRYLERLFSHDTTFRILRDMRVNLYNRFEPILPDLTGKIDRGFFVSRAVSDVEQLQDLFLRILYPTGVAILAVLVGTVAVWFVNPAFSLTYFATSLSAFLLAYLAILLSASVHKTLPAVKQRIYGTFIECSYGAMEIVLHSKEKEWKEKVISTLSKEESIEKRAAFEASVGSALSLSFPQIVMMTTLIAGAILVDSKQIDPLMIAIVPLAAAALFEAIAPLFFLGSRIHKTAASVDRLEIETNCSTESRAQNIVPLHQSGNCLIRVENLSFAYDPRRPILNNLNLELNRGTVTLLCGNSGIGKTTLTNCLTGFLSNYEGTISLVGTDIRSLSPEQIREQISVSDQKPFFFSDTIATNLRLADSKAYDHEILAVLDRVGLSEKIGQLKKGINTYMSELGNNFSGGELQRLSIARAMLKKSPVYIFDEPTSGLDATTETIVLHAIKSLATESAVLIISHRPYHEDLADQVIRLG